MIDKIAFVKTGWSVAYQGGAVLGRYSYLRRHRGAGYEACNFLPDGNGTFRAYVPPIGEQYAIPKPKDPNGWLVVFVAAKEGRGPITVVGWYRDATFHRSSELRPEYKETSGFPLTSDRKKYSYCISAPAAHLIPIDHRTVTISGSHFRSAAYIAVRGDGKSESWRKKLAELADSLTSTRATKTIRTPSRATIVFPDPEHRRRVEHAAIAAAKRWLKQHEYAWTSTQHLLCGYDLLGRHRATGAQLHVEVKGTSTETDYFYITQNEWLHSDSPFWRLALVTNALASPQTTILTREQIDFRFSLEPLAYRARSKARV